MLDFPVPDEILTNKVVAVLLEFPEKFVFATKAIEQIPVVEIRGTWRIRRTDRDRWIDSESRGRATGGGGANGR